MVTFSGILAMAGPCAAAGAHPVGKSDVQVAQQSTSSAPVGVPGSTSRPNPFPSSSAAGGSEAELTRNEAYFAAMRKCQTLPSEHRPDCVTETKKKFGEM